MVRRTIGQRFGALMSGALTVALAGLIANVLNLGVSFLIARRLNPSDYGAYSQLMGMFFIVALPGSALSVAVIRRATFYLVQNDEDLIHRWQRRLNHRILRLAIGFSLIALLGSLFIAQWLGHRSWLAVWVNTLAAITWAILNVDRALLQSRQRYSALATNFILEGFTRTIFMVLLTPFGVTGIVLGLLIGIGLTRLHARRLVGTKRVDREGPELERTGITSDLLIALATLTLLATLQFLDVLLVGRYQGGVAGSYSAISQVAKTLVYGAIILGSFLLPETTRTRCVPPARTRWRTVVDPGHGPVRCVRGHAQVAADHRLWRPVRLRVVFNDKSRFGNDLSRWLDAPGYLFAWERSSLAHGVAGFCNLRRTLVSLAIARTSG